jgi:parallel beta-helix repeat protein
MKLIVHCCITRFIGALLLVALSVTAHAAIRYVKPVASGLGNGSSWANASSDLQLMMNLSSPNDEVWVAAGTYLPIRRADAHTGAFTPGNRLNAFVMKPGVGVYGGFAGTETLLTQRNWSVNQTILSGDINTPDIHTDNSYHVVIIADSIPVKQRLDGFFIQHGYTNVTGSIPVLGITVALTSGAGIIIEKANPIIANCVIRGNYSEVNGGGVCNHGSSSTFINCVFSGNYAALKGSAVHFSGTIPVYLYNCTVAGNRNANDGLGVIENTGPNGVPVIRNSIIFLNNQFIRGNLVNVSNCILQGMYPGSNNIESIFPLFVDWIPFNSAPTILGNYRLTACSPAIDHGDIADIPSGVLVDVDNNPRVSYGSVDAGAYEYIAAPLAVPDVSGIVYVDSSKTGNGSSWANAVPELADALVAAKLNNAIQQIWVAKGTYKPKYNAGGPGPCIDILNRHNAFVLESDVPVYGGFAGTETLLSQRNWLVNKSILSGDIGIPNFLGDNAYHVVISAGSGTQILDGFTITKGNASYSGLIKVNGINVEAYRGGGVAISSASPVIRNCTIQENFGQNGGGMSVFNSSPDIISCSFLGNTAGVFGAAIDNWASSSSTISNSVFSGNRSYNVGGAFVNTSPSTMKFTNCTVSGNYATSGGALYNPSTATEIFENCIIWGNRAGNVSSNNFSIASGTASATNCIVEGGYSGTNIYNSNPAFVAPVVATSAPTLLGDYRLQICSPAINTGNNSLVPVTITTDLDLDPRHVNTTVDLGAYEFQTSNVKAVPNGSGIVFVDHTKTGNGNSWANAVPELADALRAAKSNPAIQQIWVAKGTYYPLYEPVGLSCTPDDNREKTFLLVNNVKVYGGFAGGEATIAGRNFVTNETILSGDVGMLNDSADFVYHVVMSAGAVGTAELNGFTVTKGNGSINKSVIVNAETIDSRLGGGLVCFNSSPIIFNCVFSKNRAALSGGGVYMYAGSGTTFSNCTLSENYAGNGGGLYISDVSTLTNFINCGFTGNLSSNGGGAYINLSNTRFISCLVTGNSAITGGGGMYYLASVNAGLINCLISGNKASIGGGVRSGSSAPRFDNCTISGNNATSSGSGLYFTIAPASGQPFIYNSIVYFNRLNGVTVDNIVTASGGANATPDVYYSIIGNAGGYDNISNNSSADPLFINPQSALLAPTSAGNYALQVCSPAINTGNNLYIPVGITTDIIGNTRILNVTVDRGAYEISSTDPVTPNGSGIVFVDKTKNGTGNSWTNAVSELADALKAAKTNVAITQIWVAKGTYYPFYHTSTLLCNPAIDRDKAFVLVNNVKLYGGFEGGETLLTQRNPAINETILSGDIGVADNHTDNAFHVIIGAGGVGTAVVEGFTIKDGRADSTGTLSVNSQLVSRSSGGGISLYASSPAIKNCKVMSNSSGSGGGGGIYATSSNTEFSNCLVTGNSSLGSGGGMNCNSVFSNTTLFYNCTFSGNKANNGGGINFTGTAFDAPKMYNCIVYGNQTNAGGLNSDIRTSFGSTEPEVRFSTIGNTPASGPYDDQGGNNTVNPLFIDPQSAALAPTLAGDYRLQKCSPAINTGSNSNAPLGNELDNNPRIAFTTVDRGAYEITLAIPGGSGIIYVNKNNPVTDGDGSSWENALLELGDALLAARNNAAITEIWVAKGTYYPIYDPVSFSCGPTDNRTKTFLLVTDVKVYGGFAGGETSIAGRDFVTNETILSGDLGTLNNVTDNAYHVVVSAGVVNYAVLDGFTITGGNANVNSTITVNGQPINARLGAGIMLYSSTPFITNCVIKNNTSSLDGGGMYAGVISTTGLSVSDCIFMSNSASNGGGLFGTTISSLLTFRDCIFTGNTATNGAGAYFNTTVLNLIRSTFSDNSAIAGGGGFFLFTSVNATLNNCLISGNQAQTGGAIRSASSSPRFNNCTIAGNNVSVSGGGLYFVNAPASGQPLMYNSIVYGNRINGATVDNIVTASGGANATPDVSYSIIENAAGYDNLGNNSTANPFFILLQPASTAPNALGNYRLRKCSPAINTGFNAFAPLDNDLDANVRIAYATVDRGAYEKVLASPDNNGIVYVDNDILSNEGDGSSWSSAVAELADALKAAKTNSAITQIWVANGTYSPLYDATDDGLSLTCPTVHRDNSFVLVNNVKLYGGFAGGETDTTGRDFVANETILSGDFDKNDVITGSGPTLSIAGNAENAHHVVISAGNVGAAELDGFTVTKGAANEIFSYITVNSEPVNRRIGGGMYIITSSPKVKNCIISRSFSIISGGGLLIAASSPIVTSCTISENISNSGGGVEISSSFPEIDNCVFSNNMSLHGGGMNNNQSSPTIMKCTFSNNAATGNGGAMRNSTFSFPIIDSCLFTNNSSVTGGGIHNSQSSPIIDKSIFSHNVSSSAGGAVVNMSSSSGLINNCLFFKNTSNFGGAISINSSNDNPILINCTIAENTALANGGGIYTNGNDLVLVNSIVWGNILVGPNSINKVGVTGISDCIFEGGYTSGTNIYDTDPLFIDPANDNYRLQPCSPGINTGDNGSVSTLSDLDGNPRIALLDVDLGAYEKQTADYTSSTIWRGVNTDWNNKVNWCGGFIPTDVTNVSIPTGLSNYPVTDAENAVKNITLGASTSIGTSATGSLTINGTYTNSGSTISNNGTWVMAGNEVNQTFPGTLATVSSMNNLTINNPNGIKIDKSFEISGALTPADGNINVDNATITLNSDATATAMVAPVQSGASISYTGTGKFEVERYIPPHRAWRLLTAPVSDVSNLTISDAWQEGVSNASRLAPVNPAPGFGTTITKSTTYSAADGYDQGSTNSPSIRYYNGTNWGGFPSKTIGTTPGANDGLINDQPGYMLFVRGNRGIQVAGTDVTATVTTLRPKGELKTGPQPITCSGWTVIGNPYASPINFHKIVADNPGLPDVFYVWDANLAGSFNVGGWVSYGSYDGGTETYTVAPLLPGSSFANNKGDISSGSAFMVNYTGTITIDENHKSTSGDNVLYRPVRQLSMNLYVANADGSETLNDGVVIKMETSPRAANAEKNANFTENLAIAFEGKSYAIQNRRRPHFNDTIFIHTGQMKQRSYVLELKADKLDMPRPMQAWLEDVYLHRYQTVSLEGQTRYAFSVNADSSSASAARFRLLFKKAPRFKHITAAAKQQDIDVQWAMEEDFGIAQYEVERSVNGIDFITIGNQLTNSNQQPHLHNQWLDFSPSIGTYYYRIKATGINGEVLYSDVAKVVIVKNMAGMYVYPNPVTGNIIQLRMNMQSAGQYSALLFGQNGEKIFAQQWYHSGNFENTLFELPAMIAGGIYQLYITNGDGKQKVISVEIHK